MFAAKDERKRKRRSSSTDNTTMLTFQNMLHTEPGLSSSLDEESGLEESLIESDSLPPSVMNDFSNDLDNRPHSSYSKKSANEEQLSIGIPKLKLKPRPKGRSNAAVGYRMDSSRSKLRSPFKTPPPRIYIPFLPSLPNTKYSSTKGQNRPPSQKKPMSPPQMTLPCNTQPSAIVGSYRDSKIQHKMNTSDLLLRPRKSRQTMALSKPPQLIPSFDFGISAATSGVITPRKRPAAPFTPPPSFVATNTPLSMKSVEAFRKNSVDRAIVVAKPIARRPLITPSDISNSNIKIRKRDKFSAHGCRARRLFPSSIHDHERTSAASSLVSSTASSAFSSSSKAPSSSLATTIQRALSEDADD